MQMYMLYAKSVCIFYLKYSSNENVAAGLDSFFWALVIYRSHDLVIQRIQSSYHNYLPTPKVKRCRCCKTNMTVVRDKSENSIHISFLNQYRERFTNEPSNGDMMAKKEHSQNGCTHNVTMLAHPQRGIITMITMSCGHSNIVYETCNLCFANAKLKIL